MLKSLSLCFFSLAALATATTTQAATALYANQQLSVNQSIRSGNNAYYAIMQNDGNFVVYKNDGSGKAIWSTGTNGSAAVKAIMQNDGNFVLYDANNHPIWATYGYGQGNFFYVDDEGFARVDNTIITWSSNTGDGTKPAGVSPIVFPAGYQFIQGHIYSQTNDKYRLVFQGDGNMVLYKNYTTPIWNSKTAGSGANVAEMAWGPLTLLNTAVGVVWQAPTSSSTFGWNKDQIDRSGTYLVLMPDGNLVQQEPVHAWAASAGDVIEGPHPGGDGPACVGDPDDCDPYTFPIFQYPW